MILSKAEYDRLAEAAEMLADITAYDEARRELEAGAELIPASVVNALIAGESPVRVWRNHRGLTLARLAELTGVSAAYLSQIESGARKGTAGTLKKIAVALSVDLDDLI